MMVASAEGVDLDKPMESIEATSRVGSRVRACKARGAHAYGSSDSERRECGRQQASQKKEMLPAPLEARPPAPKTGPPAKALPRGPSAVGGPCLPRPVARPLRQATTFEPGAEPMFVV